MRREEVLRAAGRIEVKPKGALRMLEEWLRGAFRSDHGHSINEIFVPLRKVRKLRQKPAHSIQSDCFDSKFFKEQRELILDVYQSMRRLRMILQKHPAAGTYGLDELLRDGKIRIL